MLPKGYTMIYDHETDEAGVWSVKSNSFLKIYPPRGRVKYRTVVIHDNGRMIHLLLHRLIAYYFIDNPDDKEMVDHIDGDPLNNRISNLRWASRSENNHNQHSAKGYTWNKRSRKWQAKMQIDGKVRGLGYFDTEEEARAAYEAASKKHYPGIKAELDYQMDYDEIIDD